MDVQTIDYMRAIYAVTSIRYLRLTLANYKACLEDCTIPSRRMWYQARIAEVEAVLLTRTGTRW